MISLSDLQDKIGYTFQNIDLLRQALTHRSFLNENPQFTLGHNERLEFYGDAVLEDIVTAYLFHNYTDKNEGELTNLRAALVRGAHLAQVADKIQLNQYLNISKGEKNDATAKAYITANAIEAIIAALRLDGGYEVAQKFIEDFIILDLDTIIAEQSFIDSKSLLQEKSQEKFNITPHYKVISEEGPDHNKIFEVMVYIDSIEYSKGRGSSKQKAEQDAAKKALDKI
jgi:ribonuclease III